MRLIQREFRLPLNLVEFTHCLMGAYPPLKKREFQCPLASDKQQMRIKGEKNEIQTPTDLLQQNNESNRRI